MKLLGPVFWYDLVRVARRQRLALWRALYASLLLVALYLMYASTFPYAGLFWGYRVKGNELAAFATQFFGLFAAVQFGAIILLTPALTAGALAEERSQNTLLFLFTTHLTNREIVLGKLMTRLLQVGLLVLTGLPVLGILQLFGGVDQLLVVAAFVGAGVTALSLGALGIACAVFAFVMPVVFFPISKSSWAAIDLAMRPLEPYEEADAETWVAAQASKRSRKSPSLTFEAST